MWGNSTESYSYSEVESFEMSIKYGVEYDIVFNNEEKIDLCSHEIIWLNYFKDEENLQLFDELLEEHAKRNVYKSIYSTPKNLKKFFRDDKVFNYFNNFFNVKTGDVSVS